jgi:uncharacterized protein YggE
MVLGSTGCETLSPPSSTPAASGLSGIFSQQNTGVWVTGEGSVSVVPDVAILSLGVEAQTATVAEAQGLAAAAMMRVMAELDNFGIADKDIRTQRFSISPIRQWSEAERREILVGYRVTNTVSVKVRNIDDAGALIDAAAAAGGDYIRINSISFTVDDTTPYREEVRELAVADAEAKAKQLADLAGVRLGQPTYISEGGGFAPAAPEFFISAPLPAAAPAPTSISPGETEIRLSIQMAYSIE